VIVPMKKALVACRRQDREQLLARLQQLGVLHVVPADPKRAVPDETATESLTYIQRALHILADVQPAGARPEIEPVEAAREVLAIRRRRTERETRLGVLQRHLRQLEIWGNARLEQFDDLLDAGAEVRLLAVPANRVADVRAQLVQVLGPVSRQRRLVAVVNLATDGSPPGAEALPLPARDRASIQEEAAELDRAIERDMARRAQLAHLVPEMEAERTRLEEEARWSVTVRSGLANEDLFAVQGWVPAETARTLHRKLQATGLVAAVQIQEPRPDERPPTLIRYPRWARPIQGLFDMLGMLPGYDEFDLSGVFVVALPIFAGMLIGDAGYGLLFLAVPLALYRKATAAVGSEKVHLLMMFGTAALAWGAITGVWFGLNASAIAAAGGIVGDLGRTLQDLVLVRGSEAETRTILIKICFVIGTSHLIVAHVRRFLALSPASEAIAEIGWCVVLTAMLGLIWILFFGSGEAPHWLPSAVIAGLATGLAVVIFFGAPDPSLARRLGMGLAGSLLPLTGTFSDTLSYIRLMAVGLASYYLGFATNTLAAQLAATATWFAGSFVLILGHLINIGLVLIAIFAHGVRLNLLEFSSNAGVQWTGYPYRPFADRRRG
jgi:V/A-type H+/Na+-transporting ATPase subunit I